MKPVNVELHIEELVLHGFSGIDRHELNAAVRSELTRLISEQGIPGHLEKNGTAVNLDGGSFHVALGANSETIGKRVAEAVFRGQGK